MGHTPVIGTPVLLMGVLPYSAARSGGARLFSVCGAALSTLVSFWLMDFNYYVNPKQLEYIKYKDE